MATITNVVSGKDHAIVGVAADGIGTHGTSKTSTGAGGVSGSGIGVHGVSTAGPGVRGDAENGVGVFGVSRTSTGAEGLSDAGTGVHGTSKTGEGVFGVSDEGRGVVGVSTAVEGNSTSGTGVWASSSTGEGLHVESKSPGVSALAVYNTNETSQTAAVFAKKSGSQGQAGYFDGAVHVTGALSTAGTFDGHGGTFDGDVHVTGVITTDKDIILANADCAEDFDISGADSAEPGMVMVLADDGGVRLSSKAYDTRVVGVISGAGQFRPGICP